MEALAGERVEEARGIADQEPAAAGPPGHPVAERPGADDRVGRAAAAPLRGVVVGRRDRRHDRVGDGPCPASGKLGPPRPSEHDAHVHQPTGDGCDPDVAVAQQTHPGIARGRRSGIAEVIGQADPRPQARQPAHAGGAGHDRPPSVGADHHRSPKTRGAPVRLTHPEPAGGEVDCGHSPARPDLRAGPPRQLEERRIESRPIEPDCGLAAGIGAVGQPERRPARRFDPHRRDRPGDGKQRRLVDAGSSQRSHRRWRGEHAAGTPAPYRIALQDDDFVPGVRQPGRQHGSGRSTADHGDLDLLGGHPPGLNESGSADDPPPFVWTPAAIA